MSEALAYTIGKKRALFVAQKLSLYKEVGRRSIVWSCGKINF